MIEPRPDERISLNGSTFAELWQRFFREVFQTLNGTLPPRVPVVTLATLPSPSPAGRIVPGPRRNRRAETRNVRRHELAHQRRHCIMRS